ncbi:hypothetical protein PC128_g24276 [Phytophthora cactorum]|nr:hypothetical protein PC128_g24276 [Phytophthora cactorum]KAG4052391.1 hypothetical protein PC123_g12436 [Phytophthora cactorum]
MPPMRVAFPFKSLRVWCHHSPHILTPLRVLTNLGRLLFRCL